MPGSAAASQRTAAALARGELLWVGMVSSSAGRDDVAVDAEDDVRYAISGDARLAFRVFAGGPHDIVWVPSWITNQDLAVRDPGTTLMFERLSSFARSVAYDQRGTGLSDPVSLAELPTLEGWTDDLHAVVTAAGLDEAVLLPAPRRGRWR